MDTILSTSEQVF